LETQQKNVKIISGSSPYYDLSSHTTYSQTQNGATVSVSQQLGRTSHQLGS
jgi:hypothetical protein